jgi:hypothetical protein
LPPPGPTATPTPTLGSPSGGTPAYAGGRPAEEDAATATAATDAMDVGRECWVGDPED